MAKIGRNAPCPCGSGKKYKQCCLAQDEAARQTTVTVATPGPSSPPPVPAQAKPFQPPPPPPPDPHMEAINARWEAYEALDYEGRIALFGPAGAYERICAAAHIRSYAESMNMLSLHH